MQRTIHRLETTIRNLQHQNQQLLKQKQGLQQALQKAKDQCEQSRKMAIKFNISSIIDQEQPKQQEQRKDYSESLRNLQEKVSVLNWELLQLQSLNSQYEQAILKLEEQKITSDNKQYLYKAQIAKLSQQLSQKQMQDDQENKKLKQILQQWSKMIQQKTRIVRINEQLQKQNQFLIETSNKKMKALIQLNINLAQKLTMTESEIAEQLVEKDHYISELKIQNQQITKNLSEKNKLLNLYLSQSGGEEFIRDKFNDMQTIRCLRKQLMNKNHLLQQILEKMRQMETIKNEYQQVLVKHKQIKQKSDKLVKQNKDLHKKKIELQSLCKKIQNQINLMKASQQEEDNKIYSLLLQNEACHHILFQIKDSHLYKRQLQEKIYYITNQIQKRAENGEQWTTITQLINVNRNLRTKLNYDKNI